MEMLESFIKILVRKSIQKEWRSNNKHNHTTLHPRICAIRNRELLRNGLITIGKYTYGEINASTFGNDNEKLVIGNYCSIAGEVLFILGGEHNYKRFTTYPFKAKIQGEKCDSLCRGPIIVDDDVWIGQRATIMSGVHIGRGAIVAAGALVVDDVPEYSIVGGVPAKVINYRFEQTIIDKLKKIRFDELDSTVLLNNMKVVETDITDNNVDLIVDSLMKEKK